MTIEVGDTVTGSALITGKVIKLVQQEASSEVWVQHESGLVFVIQSYNVKQRTPAVAT